MKKVIYIVSINIILILLTSCVGKTTTMKLDGNKVSISEFGGWQFLHPLNEVSKDNEMVEVSERRMNDEGGCYGASYEVELYNQKYGIYAVLSLAQYDDVKEFQKNDDNYWMKVRYHHDHLNSLDRDYLLRQQEHKFGNNTFIPNSYDGCDYPSYYKDLSNNCYFTVWFYCDEFEVRNENANTAIEKLLSKIIVNYQ